MSLRVPLDKGLCVVVRDHEDYIAEAERQLDDVTVYKNVNFKEKLLQDLAETSNKLFRNLKSKGGITKKELKLRSFKILTIFHRML